MPFESILFEKSTGGERETFDQPAFFTDLNLDQVIERVTANKRQYNLKPFYYTVLNDRDTILYRQEIMRDLEGKNLFDAVEAFAQSMESLRESHIQAGKLKCIRQKESWFLDSVEIYCGAVCALKEALEQTEIKSRGFLSLREYLDAYTGSEGFLSLMTGAKQLKADLSAVHYCVHINDNVVRVRKYESEEDLSACMLKTFENFRQGAADDYIVSFREHTAANSIEQKILDMLSRLYPGLFSALDRFCGNNRNYPDKTLAVFDREVQFYMAYLEYASGFKEAGLKFCYPEVTNKSKEIYNYKGYDIALAANLAAGRTAVVCNDFFMERKERILVVSGPNQGGKTTFARAFGQMHYLACIGCPVPGSAARLFLFDRLFTYFEKEEDSRGGGKLLDDLKRIRDILSRATENSIIIINEMFHTAALKDAVFLAGKVMEKIFKKDLLCVCVTFIVELAGLYGKAVSMAGTVEPEKPDIRTFKIVRRPADGLAYAITIAQKYGLTYDCLMERIKS